MMDLSQQGWDQLPIYKKMKRKWCQKMKRVERSHREKWEFFDPLTKMKQINKGKTSIQFKNDNII